MKKRHIIKWLLIAVLSWATFFWLYWFDKYEDIGPELIEDGHLNAGMDHWLTKGKGTASLEDDDSVVLKTTGDQSIQLYQPVPNLKPSDLVMLTADMRTSDVKEGKKGWHQARLDMLPFGRDGKWIGPQVSKFDFPDETQPWAKQWAVAMIPEGAVEVRARVGILHTGGTLWVKNISLHKVKIRPSFNWTRLAFALLWICLAVFLALPVPTHVKSKLKIAALGASVGLVLLAVLAPSSVLLAVVEGVNRAHSAYEAGAANEPGASSPAKTPEPLEQLAIFDTDYPAIAVHGGLFLLLAMVSMWCFPKEPLWKLLIHLAAFAVITEILQTMTINRDAQLDDIGVDCAGIAVGVGVTLLARRWKRQSL